MRLEAAQSTHTLLLYNHFHSHSSSALAQHHLRRTRKRTKLGEVHLSQTTIKGRQYRKRSAGDVRRRDGAETYSAALNLFKNRRRILVDEGDIARPIGIRSRKERARVLVEAQGRSGRCRRL
jgi:hypothetical protein